MKDPNNEKENKIFEIIMKDAKKQVTTTFNGTLITCTAILNKIDSRSTIKGNKLLFFL